MYIKNIDIFGWNLPVFCYLYIFYFDALILKFLYKFIIYKSILMNNEVETQEWIIIHIISVLFDRCVLFFV